MLQELGLCYRKAQVQWFACCVCPRNREIHGLLREKIDVFLPSAVVSVQKEMLLGTKEKHTFILREHLFKTTIQCWQQSPFQWAMWVILRISVHTQERNLAIEPYPRDVLQGPRYLWEPGKQERDRANQESSATLQAAYPSDSTPGPAPSCFPETVMKWLQPFANRRGLFPTSCGWRYSWENNPKDTFHTYRNALMQEASQA